MTKKIILKFKKLTERSNNNRVYKYLFMHIFNNNKNIKIKNYISVSSSSL